LKIRGQHSLLQRKLEVAAADTANLPAHGFNNMRLVLGVGDYSDSNIRVRYMANVIRTLEKQPDAPSLFMRWF